MGSSRGQGESLELSGNSKQFQWPGVVGMEDSIYGWDWRVKSRMSHGKPADEALAHT